MTDLNVLLIEDDADHTVLIRRLLANASRNTIAMECVDRLAPGLERLDTGSYSAVLCDLRLPDSDFHQTLNRILERAPDVPVIALTSLDDLELAARAVQSGAQDYLVKTQLSGELLLRSIRYAIERKRSQRQLQQYARELERSNRELQQFASTVAHELRTPLSIAGSALHLVDQTGRESLSGDILEIVDAGQDALRRLGNLITDLLEYARVGAREKVHGPVDCRDVVDRAIEALGPQIQESRAVVECGPLPQVLGDRDLLIQLLQNLIGNATKYHGPRPPVIRVLAERDRDRWRMTVSDNGLGIPAADRERVFRIFERLPQAEGRPGTGVGLAICQRIVERHGGTIWADESPEGGSRFHFTLTPVPGEIVS